MFLCFYFGFLSFSLSSMTPSSQFAIVVVSRLGYLYLCLSLWFFIFSWFGLFPIFSLFSRFYAFYLFRWHWWIWNCEDCYVLSICLGKWESDFTLLIPFALGFSSLETNLAKWLVGEKRIMLRDFFCKFLWKFSYLLLRCLVLVICQSFLMILNGAGTYFVSQYGYFSASSEIYLSFL